MRVAAFLFVVVVVAGAVVMVWPAFAQSGSCPSWAWELFPTPFGTSPGSLKFCDGTNEVGTWSLFVDQDVPCAAGLKYNEPLWVGDIEWPLVIVPPTTMNFSGDAKFQFYIHGQTILGGQITEGIVLHARSYGPGGNLLHSISIPVDDFPATLTPTGLNIWKVQNVLIHAETSGYMTLSVWEPVTFLGNGSFYIESFGITQAGQPGAEMCDIPDTPTPTPTNTATSTPTVPPFETPTPDPSITPSVTATTDPAATSTATPSITAPAPTTTSTSTAWSTAPGGTITPLPTATQMVIITVPPENTPTPWPAVTIPALDIPQVEFPVPVSIDTPEPIVVGLTPNATTIAMQVEIEEWVSDVGVVATRWYTSTQWGVTTLSTTVSSSTGISSPVAIAAEMAEAITTPISYAKAVQFYMPNLWPMVFFLLIATAWIFFNLIAKFGIAIGSELLELLYKIWEALPLN
jgi:hypothetical protein